jgi:NAD(P)-dependent dehydrogenase (short-subunit alcohol dehydrogenase family)
VTVNVEHYDLTGRNAVAIGNSRAIVDALGAAYEEAGALTTRIHCRADEAEPRLAEAIAAHGSLDVLATGFDAFVSKPLADTTTAVLMEVMLANCASQVAVCRRAVAAMKNQHHGGNLVVVTNVLGERGLPGTTAYAAAHGAVHNFVRAAAQELAPRRIVINGIALGWMAWMDDRLDPADPEAARALRFPIVKGPGRPSDLGPLAVWLSGSGAGYVTGQIFPLDGGLTQHL